jgi:hypothetical protein
LSKFAAWQVIEADAEIFKPGDIPATKGADGAVPALPP